MIIKLFIFITIILTLLFGYAGLSIYNYGLAEKQIAYQEGYIKGLVYTSETGKIAYIENGILKEIPIEQECNNLIEQGGLEWKKNLNLA